jgi:hypothetical protein
MLKKGGMPTPKVDVLFNHAQAGKAMNSWLNPRWRHHTPFSAPDAADIGI